MREISEIKFRAWDKKNKEMVDVLGLSWFWIDVEGISEMIIGTKNNTQRITKYGIRDFILMRFTGIHDKNGREIYEGDILKLNSELFDLKDEIFIVDNFYYDVCYLNSFNNVDENDSIEVVGNIYENPELLKDN